MAVLNEAVVDVQSPERAGAALLKADAAYRLGSAACSLGLGHVALLADALGLAWRRVAHGVAPAGASWSSGTVAQSAARGVAAPDATALERAGEALRAMLLKVAVGVAQPDSSAAVQALGLAIGDIAR
jgi:hypothetical protein